MTPIGFGIDVSAHQNPDVVPWEKFRGKVDFVICRAGYGSTRDKHVVEHVARARSIGAKVGIYLFYRPSEEVGLQLDTLLDVAHDVGLGAGDIVPALDIEEDPLPSPQEVTPAWSRPCEEFVRAIAAQFGNALVYVTQREFGFMGSPAWVLEFPLWVAHYGVMRAPATPGNAPATLWQHRVANFDPLGPGGYYAGGGLQLDQNRLLAPLPLIPATVTDADRERVAGLVAETLDESTRDTDPLPPPEEIA